MIRKCLATATIVAAIVLIPATAWANVTPNPQPSPGTTHSAH